LIRLCFRSPQFVATDEDISIVMVPKLSAPIKINLNTPNLFNSKKIYLYPSKTMG
jgi:hypothetical protein